MAKELKGTNVAAGIVPFTDQDNYATHFAKYGKGGYRTVETIEERDSIPADRREEGMLCYVVNDPSQNHTYQLISDEWKILRLGPAGIPIYDQETLETLGSSAAEKYIYVPSENDLVGQVTDYTYKTSENGNYLDILFSTIRQLQIEVARMRNAFKYGIYSYTGTDTAMSGVINDIPEPEEEPLWAVEPDMLSLITGADVLINEEVQNLTPLDNINPQKGKLVINGSAYWYDKDDLVKNCEDSKIFIYFTTSHLNIKLNLESFKENDTEEPESLEIDLSKTNIMDLDKYNVLTVISRKSKDLGGKNFVWVSIGNPETNTTLVEGYYDLEKKKPVSTVYELDKAYTVKTIELSELNLYQLDFYSKYQEFTKDVLPSKPNDQDYKYRVAHLTIRSVANTDELEQIKQQLPNNELIFEEANSKLWIKSKNRLIAIVGTGGGGGTTDSDMTTEQLIEELKNLGIIYESMEEGEATLKLSSIGDITFIHQGTGKQFKFEVDSEGSLVSSELPDKTLEDRIKALSKTSYAINENDQIRGFVAKLHCGEENKNAIEAKDVKLNSDRVKIGSMYLPLSTDTTFGCSHAYVELENTSDQDFPLSGCYLHFLHADSNGNPKVSHLALDGILRSGSTFLIRGKQYSDPKTNSNTYIVVDDFDMEWYEKGELIDFTADPTKSYGFALTYGQPSLSYDTTLVSENNDSTTKSKAPNVYPYFFIDSIPLNNHVNNTKPWGTNYVTIESNSIIKNMFELDPAKQAFQSLNTYDSSRARLANVSNDIQVVSLAKETIAFPHSEEEYPVALYSPKSSKQKKNVCTDKTAFNMEKPNAVTCAFGINMYTTRCFNWVSGGEFDEYVWLKKDDGSWDKFESYKKIENRIEDSNKFPRRKEFASDINNTIYARLIGNFPGCGIHYSAHKCIIEVTENSLSEPKTYTYVVGRSDKTGNAPDPNHTSEEQTFTLYPESYTPRIYQITDQQGFHWVEYQVWAASSNFLNNKIQSEVEAENIIPVLINTGDMTQNGTRVNEWLDYFNGGKSLLNHLEHMAVVGNNDLCGPDPEILGTGDDSGKSNSYYFHVFFCYEVFNIETDSKIITPIVNNKYIPSLYYFDSKDYRFLMANSEITYASCKTWYGLDRTEEGNDRIYNLYTGWGVTNSANDQWNSYNTDSSFTSIYTMMWNILNNLEDKKPIIACHEMPFTVITTECIANSTNNISRSISGTSLVGCHMNQLTPNDNRSLYWFSRLCEFFKVKLVIGGHKHTYAATLPVREYYTYDNGNKNSLTDGPMEMLETLENDWCGWEIGSYNSSKKPILYNYSEATTEPYNGYFWPYTNDEVGTYKDHSVVYFMCQATGYKQTSNKELPTNYQSFSSIIPNSKITIGSDGKVASSKADDAQKYPMYLKIKLNNDSWDLILARIGNIQKNYKFNQHTFSEDIMTEEFAQSISDSKFVNWVSTEQSIINIEV